MGTPSSWRPPGCGPSTRREALDRPRARRCYAYGGVAGAAEPTSDNPLYMRSPPQFGAHGLEVLCCLGQRMGRAHGCAADPRRSRLCILGHGAGRGDPSSVCFADRGRGHEITRRFLRVPGNDGGVKVSSTRGGSPGHASQPSWDPRDRPSIARLALRHVEWISDRLAAVSVDWLGLGPHEVERSRESSFYIMRVGDDGVARIHVAMSRLPAGGLSVQAQALTLMKR
jgi:hypothetical protein